jgi:glyoxylase-like metal-dependent hydrolase (beta-lactamase superfamily II)
MKRLHRKNLWCWSVFDERLNIDFNSFAWVREGGNVVVDPLPMTAHDKKHLRSLGGAALIVVTNSDHARNARACAEELGASLAGPRAERANFPLKCDRWLGDGEEVVPGLVAYELEGSKTPGELALVLEGKTLIFGDLVRAHRAGSLMLLSPEQKLKDARLGKASVRKVLEKHEGIDAVLVGDGWCSFEGGALLALTELMQEEEDSYPSERGASDSGRFKIPASRSSIPAPRAGSKCSFCGKSADEHRLVSGTAMVKREPAAICTLCAARLECGAAAARCDFCQQSAGETAAEQGTVICRECLDLALAIFGDGEA